MLACFMYDSIPVLKYQVCVSFPLTIAESISVHPLMAAFAALRVGVPFAASSILYSVADSALFPS